MTAQIYLENTVYIFKRYICAVFDHKNTTKSVFRWRASLWKSVWRQLLLYFTLYLAISLIYRFFEKNQNLYHIFSKNRFVLMESPMQAKFEQVHPKRKGFLSQ